MNKIKSIGQTDHALFVRLVLVVISMIRMVLRNYQNTEPQFCKTLILNRPFIISWYN